MRGKVFTDAWGPSKFSCYNQCPRQFRHKYLDKLPDPPGPAMARGTVIHSAAELYIKGELEKPSADLKKVTPLLKELKREHGKKMVHVELELGLDSKWRKLENWFHPTAWIRIKIDVVQLVTAKLAKVIDWKSGKYKPDEEAYNDQLNLYSTCVLSAGYAEEAIAQLVFTDGGQTVDRPSGQLTLAKLKDSQKAWEKKVKPMYKDRSFDPRPGFYCRWCAYSRAKGGPCAF